jgi:hypothetical protein
MDESARQRRESTMLFALVWPLPTYAFVGSALIVVNEHLLHAHVFDASTLAACAGLVSLLSAAGWDAHLAAASVRPSRS